MPFFVSHQDIVNDVLRVRVDIVFFRGDFRGIRFIILLDKVLVQISIPSDPTGDLDFLLLDRVFP